MNQQDTDYIYFLDNMENFYHKYGHKFVVVKNKTILNVYDDYLTAYDETLKTEKLGTFLIQECFENEEKMTRRFHRDILVAV